VNVKRETEIKRKGVIQRGAFFPQVDHGFPETCSGKLAGGLCGEGNGVRDVKPVSTGRQEKVAGKRKAKTKQIRGM